MLQSKRDWSRAGVSTGVVVENWPEFWASSLCFFHLVLGVSKHVHALHEERLGSTALLSVLMVFKPAKGSRPPGVRPQDCGIQYVVQTYSDPV